MNRRGFFGSLAALLVAARVVEAEPEQPTSFWSRGVQKDMQADAAQGKLEKLWRESRADMIEGMQLQAEEWGQIASMDEGGYEARPLWSHEDYDLGDGGRFTIGKFEEATRQVWREGARPPRYLVDRHGRPL
jgi:hypothetical protein